MRHSDVIVIGGGIIGCAIAWRLARDGHAVTVIERGHPGAEATAASAGLIAPDARDEFSPPLLALYLDSLQRYDSFVASVVEETGMSVEYRRTGRLDVVFDDGAVSDLDRRLARNLAAGVAVERWTDEEVRRAEPALNPAVRAGLHFPDHRVLDAGRFTRLLAIAAERRGAQIITQQTVTSLVVEGERVSGVVVGGSGEVLHAGHVIVAAGSWSGTLDPRLRLPVVPVKGQMIAFETAVPPVTRIIRGPRYSANPRADGRTTFGATVELVGYDRSLSAANLSDMLAVAFELVPSLRQARFAETWTGLRPGCPVDRLPLIGWGPLDSLLVATGHWGMGIVAAPSTAEAIGGLITNGRSPIDVDAFSPRRFD